MDKNTENNNLVLGICNEMSLARRALYHDQIFVVNRTYWYDLKAPNLHYKDQIFGYDKQKNAQMFSKSEEIEVGMQWKLPFKNRDCFFATYAEAEFNFTKELNDTDTYEKEDANFECQVNDPDAKVIWFREEQVCNVLI